ncbi:MAG: VWA domain-containing protein [Desulfovibrio sp.]|uniref:vWA domain-containing protein n=1 Tax=Desulfovibrio sp. TaxID=885 RepID=UPI0025C030FB|nr:VWA domain-containing protein [Desulfovibrio sp.]MCI7569666.1 VWA domain-containing protein [Desulfovibrio sp.]
MPNEFGYDDLIDNPTPRVPVCLCLDTSGSMMGQPIDELNRGIRQFFQEVAADEVARYAVDICVVTFGDQGVKLLQDFHSLDAASCPSLTANGGTPMGEALTIALDKLAQRKQMYKDSGIDYFQPWLVIMTDGQPNGDRNVLEAACRETSSLQAERKLSIFPIGIGHDADMAVLSRISPKRPPLRLEGLKFVEFFQWLSQSLARVSQSIPGEQTDLPPTESWSTL